MNAEILQLAFYFFLIAVVYSSAGFGGGSSYLAVLALSSLPFTEIRMIALICNITVVAGSVYLMWKNGYLRSWRVAPLVLLSIPAAYIGGSIPIEAEAFYIILGVTLLVAGISMLFLKVHQSEQQSRKLSKYSNAFLGGGIGFLSGIVGIGGGIFLSPVLHFSRWGKAKTIAATTALFILVNSLAGLAGQIYSHGWTLRGMDLIILLLAVFIGGQIGIRLTISWLNAQLIKRITGVLIITVAIRLLFF